MRHRLIQLFEIVLVAYMATGAVHGYYFIFAHRRPSCLSATDGLVYWYCHAADYDMAWAIIFFGWPFYWL
jgi:hypothetical protein